METKTFKKGEIIFKQGDLSDCMYDILWGQVGIYADYGTPEEKLLTTLETERFFGEMGMIEGRLRSATAVALTPQDHQLVCWMVLKWGRMNRESVGSALKKSML